VVEHGPHEQQIAFRVAVDQPRQALRERSASGRGGEIGGDLGFAERCQGGVVTQLMHPQFLRQRLQGVVPQGQVHRPGGGDQKQLGGRPAARQGRQQIDRGVVHPLEILDDQQERPGRREGLQRFRNLAQHALARGTQKFALQGLTVCTGQQGGKLHQPGRRVRGQGLHDRVAAGPPAQLAERFQHRVVGFHTAVALQALPAGQAQARHLRRGLLLEGVDQGGFADARLPRDKDQLALRPQCQLQVPAQLPEPVPAAHQCAVGRGRRHGGLRHGAVESPSARRMVKM
jgi:hypothetical protein